MLLPNFEHGTLLFKGQQCLPPDCQSLGCERCHIAHKKIAYRKCAKQACIPYLQID